MLKPELMWCNGARSNILTRFVPIYPQDKKTKEVKEKKVKKP
jgi:hypothetical protein